MANKSVLVDREKDLETLQEKLISQKTQGA
jgi:hypothetical protein